MKNEGLIKYIPFVTGVLIFFGTIKLATTYIIFDIDIFRYAGLSEFASASIIYFILFAVIFVLIGIFVERHNKNNESKDADVINNVPNSKSHKKLDKIDIGYIVLMSIIIIIMGILAVIYNQALYWYFLLNIIVNISLAAFIRWVSNLYLDSIKGIEDSSDRKFIYQLASISAIAASGIMFFSTNSSIYLKYGDAKEFCKILLKNDSTINTTDSLIYVGKTENYTFLYSKSEEAPMILNNNEIVLVEWLKNKPVLKSLKDKMLPSKMLIEDTSTSKGKRN